jgi:hypothetical protein
MENDKSEIKFYKQQRIDTKKENKRGKAINVFSSITRI